ncbi:MAG: TetR/AcrR family transcriptional regulator [Beutenbergiaceae bacterium]
MVRRGSYAKGSARREQILSMTLRVIADKGYAAATLRGIGRELGIEPAHILYYFGTREDLLIEVIRRWDLENLGQSPLEADALAAFSAATRRNAGIRGIVQMYLAFATEASEAGHPAHDFIHARYARIVHALAGAIESGQRAGLIRRQLAPAHAARNLIAVSDGLQLQALVDATIDAPQALDAAIDAIFIGGTRLPIDAPMDRSAWAL